MEVAEGITGRFKDAQWANAKLDIIVGGAGGIGSWLTFFLARLGTNNIAVYDFDDIEVHNIGGQLYPLADVSSQKLESLADTINRFSDFSISTIPTKYEGQSGSNVMFSAFDNMIARKQMVEKWYSRQLERRAAGLVKPEDVNVFIDGRMEAEQAIIYIVDSISDYKQYQSELFDDDAVELGPCTFRATTHNAAIIGGYMVAALTNVISNKKMGGKFKAVPYKITYELPTFTFNADYNESTS
jgi:hypothetical protein